MRIDIVINRSIKTQIKRIESVLNSYGDLKIEDLIKYILNRFFKKNIYIDSIEIHINGEYNTYVMLLHMQNNHLKKTNYEIEYEKTSHDTSIIFNSDESDITEINGNIHRDIYYKWESMDRKCRSIINLSEGRKYIF